MSKQYTPGPWHIGMRPGPIVYGELGEQVADCRMGLDVSDEQRANARLIAAAPELLNACRYLLTKIDSLAPRLAGLMEYEYAKQAIAKATGQE